MTKAKDIMTREVLTVTPDTSISLAVKILTIRKLTGLPVVDERNNLLGIVSEKDLLCLLTDSTDREKPVSDFMTRDVTTFGPEDDVADICLCLKEKPFRRVPIVQDGKLCGIISRRDIIALIWEERFSEKG